MAHPGPDAGYGVGLGRAASPERVARAARTVGTALVAAALPAMSVALAAGLAAGAPPAALADWVIAAMDTPLAAVGGASWAFRVAALAAMAGMWFVGFALVVEGYFGID